MTAQTFVQERFFLQLQETVLSGMWAEVVREFDSSKQVNNNNRAFPELHHTELHKTTQIFRGLVEMTPVEAEHSPIVTADEQGRIIHTIGRLPVWHLSNVRLVVGETADGSVIEQKHPDLILNPEKQVFDLAPIAPPEDYKLPEVMVDDAIISL